MNCIGVDIGSQAHVAYFPQSQETFRFSNTQSGFAAFHQKLTQPTQVDDLQVVMEATGVYHQRLAQYLHAQGVPVGVLNPAQVKYYAKSQLRRSKSDPVDAKIISEYAQRHPVKPWEPLETARQHLQQACTAREAVLKVHQQLYNLQQALQQRAEPCGAVLQVLTQLLEQLQEAQETLEEGVQQTLDAQEELQQEAQLLQSVPGIGPVVSMQLLANTGSLRRFSCSAALVCFAGMDVRMRQSGKHDAGRHLSKVGHAALRKAAYQAALGAIRSKSHLAGYYRALRSRGKPAKVALCALARKILRIAFAVVKQGQPFDPAYPGP
jgi:transposase